MSKTIVITKEQYDRIQDMLFELQPALSVWPFGGSFSVDMSTNIVRKFVDKDDIDEYLKKYNAKLGEEIKKYNPYRWSIEIIFDNEADATLFCLMEL